MIIRVFRTFCVCMLSCVVTSAYGEAVPVDGYAAMVNDRVITIGDVLAYIQPLHQKIQTAYEGREMKDKIEEAFEAGREEMIERALILEDFTQQGGELPRRLIDDHINSIIHDKFDSDRAKFLEALAQERVTLAEWREQVREKLIIMVSRRQQVFQRISVSPRAIHDVYQSRLEEYRLPAMVKLRMIVIPKGATEQDTQAAREKTDKILTRLLNSEDFAETARSESEGSKAAQGGDWGWIEPRGLRKELAEVVVSLAPGTISEIIETGETLYILKVEEKKTASLVPFAKMKDEIAADLRRAEQEKLHNEWMQRLKDKYYVKVFSLEKD